MTKDWNWELYLLRPWKIYSLKKWVSSGRSTTVNATSGHEATRLTFSSGIGNGAGSGGVLLRWNSISQAQVGLRRDLGMVREFVSNVECGFCLAFYGLFNLTCSLIYQASKHVYPRYFGNMFKATTTATASRTISSSNCFLS